MSLLEPGDQRVYSTPEGYLSEVQEKMAFAWDVAKKNVERAQKKQKEQYDKQAKRCDFKVGDIVYVFMPAKTSGEARKLAKPNEGPFEIVRNMETGVEVRRLGRGKKNHIRICMEPSEEMSKRTG